MRLFLIDAGLHTTAGDSLDTLVATVQGIDPLAAQSVDRLSCHYLAFVADFDPEDRDEPRGWLEELWRVAKPELCTVFEYCYGFQAGGDAAAFANFVIKGQIETTMSFNDYWTIPPPIPNLSGLQLAIAPALGAIVAIGLAAMWHWAWWAGWGLILALAAAGVVFDYFLIGYLGGKPFPTAPNSTLRHVLKALYLQQAFGRFAATHQTSSPAQLRAAFADFVAATKPSDLTGPTQAPGVVRSQFAPETLGA